MSGFDLFIILAAIAIAVIIIKRAIWNAVKMVGFDFRNVFGTLNGITGQLQTLEMSVKLLDQRLRRVTRKVTRKGKPTTWRQQPTASATPIWAPTCNHPTPQYGCPDCIQAARTVEPDVGVGQ